MRASCPLVALLGVVFGVNAHYKLLASALVITTDQESPKYIQDQKLTERIQHKLLVKLLGYNYTAEYKRGKENKAADALSRVKYLVSMLTTSASVPVWITEVVKTYAADPIIKEITCAISKDENSRYTFKNGIFRYDNSYGQLY